MMQMLSKEQFISKISDIERVYLVSIHDGKVYLRADIEKGGDNGLRIEMMDFEMNTSYGFYEANSLCRSNYFGGISFIEYSSYDEAEHRAITDFLDLNPHSALLYCDDNELDELTDKYPADTDLYVDVN